MNTKKITLLLMLLIPANIIFATPEKHKKNEEHLMHVNAKKNNNVYIDSTVQCINHARAFNISQVRENVKEQDYQQSGIPYHKISAIESLNCPATVYADQKLSNKLLDTMHIADRKIRKKATATLQSHIKKNQATNKNYNYYDDYDSALLLLSNIQQYDAALTLQKFTHRQKTNREETLKKEIELARRKASLLQPHINKEIVQAAKARLNTRTMITKEMIKLTLYKTFENIDANKKHAIELETQAKELAKKEQEKTKKAVKKRVKRSSTNNIISIETPQSPTSVQTPQTPPADIQTEVISENSPTHMTLHQPASEYERYMAWLDERKLAEQALKDLKKQKEISHAKKLLQYKPGPEREAKKRELEKQTISWDYPLDEAANKILTKYSQLLHSSTPIHSFISLEKEFIQTNKMLALQGLSLRWYLASNPAMHEDIKQKYLSLQGRISQAERDQIITQAQDNDYTESLKPKLLQIVILDKLKSFHVHNNGILNTSKLIYAPISPDFFQNIGTLSSHRLLQAEQEISQHLLATQDFEFHRIKPTVSKLIQELNIEPKNELISGIINQCLEIALLKAPNDTTNYLPDIGASFFNSFRQKNEFAIQPYTQDQMSDVTKIHLSIITSIMNTIKIKKANLKSNFEDIL